MYCSQANATSLYSSDTQLVEVAKRLVIGQFTTFYYEFGGDEISLEDSYHEIASFHSNGFQAMYRNITVPTCLGADI